MMQREPYTKFSLGKCLQQDGKKFGETKKKVTLYFLHIMIYFLQEKLQVDPLKYTVQFP